MDGKYLELSYLQVAAAALLILVNGAVSLALRLRLETRLLVAAVRATVQLTLVGFVLQWAFALSRWEAVVVLMLVMTVAAGVAAVRRSKYRHGGIWLDSLVSVWASSWVVAALGVLVILRVEPWYLPQYVIPFLGMILGNALNGISLGLDRLSGSLDDHRDRIEALLAVGATRREAALPAIREAVRTGMIPIINVMTVAGIVSLPGMMTGQLLAGVSPIQAVKYQIVILFVIASATALGTVGVVLLSYRRLFNSRHQFLVERIRRMK